MPEELPPTCPVCQEDFRYNEYGQASCECHSSPLYPAELLPRINRIQSQQEPLEEKLQRFEGILATNNTIEDRSRLYDMYREALEEIERLKGYSEGQEEVITRMENGEKFC